MNHDELCRNTVFCLQKRQIGFNEIDGVGDANEDEMGDRNERQFEESVQILRITKMEQIIDFINAENARRNKRLGRRILEVVPLVLDGEIVENPLLDIF